MQHQYENDVQIEVPLYFMELPNKNPVSASLTKYFKSRSEVSHCEN